MSKFRVGQRVRVKYAETIHGKRHVGKECVVTQVERLPSWTWTAYGLDVSPIIHNGEAWLGWADDQLEPATDCYDKTEWDQCVWKPEHLRVDA